jgi:hypothetical protein
MPPREAQFTNSMTRKTQDLRRIDAKLAVRLPCAQQIGGDGKSGGTCAGDGKSGCTCAGFSEETGKVPKTRAREKQ